MHVSHPLEHCEKAEDHVRATARRRRTGRHLSVTSTWWPTADGENHHATYCLVWQGDLGSAVRMERLGAWPEACEHRDCHLMTGLVLACEHFLRTGRGPNGSLNQPSQGTDPTYWPHLLQGAAASEWRLALPSMDSAQYLGATSAGSSITEFVRYGGGVPQTEVLLHSMASPGHQWVPEQIGFGTDPACEHPWCMMEALNTTVSGWLTAHHSYPAHAEVVGRLLEAGAAPTE